MAEHRKAEGYAAGPEMGASHTPQSREEPEVLKSKGRGAFSDAL